MVVLRAVGSVALKGMRMVAVTVSSKAGMKAVSMVGEMAARMVA